jgi:putative toxin-antitoxin system antitoxin component (TIGR02293 family)
MSSGAKGMSALLEISEYIGVSPRSDLDLAELVEHGLSTESLNLLRKKGLTFTEVADLIASPRTLQHRKSKGVTHLTHDEADRVVRIARILALAEQVFGSLERGLGWLRKPDERLNDRTALSMLQTESGGRLIESMLWQVADGIYS